MLEASREIDLGGLLLRPRERVIAGRSGNLAVEPLVMQLLLALARRAGRMVDRAELFRMCWGAAPVGDDSLNRIVAVLRKALRAAGDDIVQIDTIPATGYVLRLSHRGFAGEAAIAEASHARRAGFDSWRGAFPEPDCLAIERLRRAVGLRPDDADAWGMLALMNRHAAEYADQDERPNFLSQCETAARRALEIDLGQAEAQVALASVAPLFGHWDVAHDRLSAICAAHPANVIAAHDLSIVEMATGRVSTAKAIVDRLIAADRIAATYAYKSTYHHWSVGDLETMDRRADAAIQLWPTHPALWTARFWTLAYTGRIAAAMRMLGNTAARAGMPPPATELLGSLLAAVETRSAPTLGALAGRAAAAAAQGPAQAISSLFALGLIGDTARAQAVVDAYYLHDGDAPVPNNADNESPVNETRRRLTQILFTPAGAGVRTGAAFDGLCDRIGLTRYWAMSGRTPDFRR